MNARMSGSERVGGLEHTSRATESQADRLGIALAEHYATSKSPLARGLKVINTEKATVPMRWVS
jgi:hypothetical protein